MPGPAKKGEELYLQYPGDVPVYEIVLSTSRKKMSLLLEGLAMNVAVTSRPQT